MNDDIARSELVQGLLYAHTRSNLNTIEAHHARADVLALLEVLIARGVIDRAEFEEQRNAVDEELKKEFVEKGMSVAIHEQDSSKYEYNDAVEIDCESRIDLCKAACCRLTFALSKEDVEESIVNWDLGRPYIIAHGDDGYCTHLGGRSRSCGVYKNRPLTCRKFDCRKDDRIWEDFEKRIPNPRVAEPGWPRTSEPEKQG